MSAARRKLRRQFATVVGALALALLMLGQSARDPGRLGPLDRTVLALINPLQSMLARGGQGLVGAGQRYLGLVGVQEKNLVLHEENRQLRAQVTRLSRAALENDRLNRLLGLRDLLDAPTVPARVMALDTSPYFRVTRLRIDKGSASIDRGMPVLAPEGVVGRVIRVAGGSADVELAVDPHSVIHVLVPRTGGRGLLVGHPVGGGARCRIQYFTSPTAAQVGDQVVTTGLGGFPRDLPVGTVSAVRQQPAALFQEVEVTPAVDFARLTEVLVLLAPPAGPPLPPPAGGSENVPPTVPPWPARGLSFYR